MFSYKIQATYMSYLFNISLFIPPYLGVLNYYKFIFNSLTLYCHNFIIKHNDSNILDLFIKDSHYF